MTVAMILWRVSTWAPKVYAEDVMPFAQLLQSLRQKDRVLKALKRSIMYTDFSGKSIVFIGFFLITYLFLFTYYLFFLRRSKEAVGLRGVIHRGEEKIMTFTDVLGKIDNFVWGVPLIVLIIAGVAIVWCITFFLGRRLAKTFWFERMIFAWGWWTGTMAMGIALLRIVDPKLSSKAMDDYAMAYLPIAPIEILLITFVPILFVNGLGVWLLLACLVLSLLILLLAWKMGWWITRS